MSGVIIVTNPELGWDCVVSVYSAKHVSLEDVEDWYHPSGGYMIHREREPLTEIDANE